MVRRLCILCFLLALSPGLALAQSAALDSAYNRYEALDAQGRYAEAEPFARKALELSRKEFGPDHPTTAALLNNLAELYRDQGRYAEAEPLHKRSLAIREKALGPEHDVAQSLNNMALLRMLVRIGINIGEVIVDGDDIYGDGVNVAARLQELAEPGGITISANVHEQVEGKHDERFENTGAHEFKNSARPISV